MPEGADVPGVVKRRATVTGGLRADQYIRELQLLVGKQTVELELLRAELDGLRRGRRFQGVSTR